MIHTKLLSIFTALLLSLGAVAQDNHTLLKIGNENYSVEEFDFIYNKNNAYSELPKSKKEYIDLFVNYKLKVCEAIEQGLDTLPSFTKEFNYYKEELTKPYLSDKSVTIKLKEEAYQRLNQEVNASHILILTPQSATPKDTLKAYNKILSIQEKIKNGEDFNELAAQFSEDPSAKKNQGKLGYFSGFMMVYPFESAAYNTPNGEVSDIVKTSFGYHLIKVHDKRSSRGELKAAHIMMMFAPNSDEKLIAQKKSKIDSIYQLLINGANFGELAQNYSEDKKSARKNGELPWFNSGKMIPEFCEPAYQLDSINNLSEVIRTPYGFHIIKFLEKRGVKTFDEMEKEITNRISRDERAFQSKNAVINRLKKEYSFNENSIAINTIKAKAQEANLSVEDFFKAFENSSDELFSFSTIKASTAELMQYLKNDRQFTNKRKATLIDKLISDFTDEKIIDFEKTKLSDKYPDYRFLLNEYHDGLLIFEISQKEIWNKASKDSSGIANYYAANKSNYFYPEKINGRTVFTKDKKAFKTVKNKLALNPQISNDSLKSFFDPEQVKCITGEFEKGEYQAIDKQYWNIKKSEGQVDENYPYAFTTGDVIAQKQKTLDDTKGQVIADYQTEIEKKWIVTLNEKFSPVIQSKALKFSKKAAKQD